jgi:hypothetical protein
MNFPIPNEIKDAIKSNRLVIFAGAGVSKRFNLPSWKKLVVDVIENIGNKDFETLLPVLESNVLSPIKVLDTLIGDKYTIAQYIEKEFYISDDNDFEFHKSLLKLTSKVITTNYDNAFESADPSIYVAIHDSEFKLINLSEKEKFVYKIHGCAKINAGNCVLFTKQYEELYSKETAASLRLKEQSINNTFLFIGFSMDDPYIKDLMQYVDNLFGSNKKHFMITSSAHITENIKYIKPIVLKDYSQLPDLINEWVNYKKASIEEVLKKNEKLSAPNSDLNIPGSKSIVAKKAKICLLKANPIDLEFPNLNNLLDSLNVEVFTGNLTANNLQLIDDFDYVILLTKSYKGKLYIEGEDLKSELMSLQEVANLILNDQIPLILITQAEVQYNESSRLVHVASFKANTINKFIFKYFRSGQLDIQDDLINIQNFSSPEFLVDKGQAFFYSLNGVKKQLEFNVKKSALVGRIEEQSIIASRMMKLASSNKLLNIKGSGGIGKTTLIRKISSDLYDRGYFKDGVTFNSCESIQSYQEFIDLLAKGFGLNSIDNLLEYLLENNKKLDLLILLDNFESISNMGNALDYKKIISVLEVATDYASIVITSRENLDTDFEDIFTLSSLNTDDAFQLFTNYYGDVTSKKEISTLRVDILENLLNNNPLAIKLVTRAVVKQSGIENLKNQLTEFFFETTSEDISTIYNKDEDINIERTRSIYQSINYSYCKLATKEKLALEILHLFPDGISVSNFKKCFVGKKSENNITDNELRVLQNKSLVENIEGTLKLQPLVRRFAEFSFAKRPKEIKDKYYKDAYLFNCFVLDVIADVANCRTLSAAYRLHDHHKENLILVLDYMKEMNTNVKSVVPDKRYLLNYISDLHPFIIVESQITKFNNSIPFLRKYFSDLDDADKLLDILSYRDIYFYKNFDESYNNIEDLFPHDKIKSRVFADESLLENRYKNVACNIHSMEGHTLDYIEALVLNSNVDTFINFLFFYLGIHDLVKENEIDFYYFEKEIVYGNEKVDQIEKYISSLFKEENLEKMQSTYALSKIKPLDKSYIQPLVVTNPYTRGLKELMYAFSEIDPVLKKAKFEKALKYLAHIKYYYLECLFFYSKFLLEIGDSDFDVTYNEGLTLSKKFHYQLLEFKFINLINNPDAVYQFSYGYYPISGLEEYVSEYNKAWQKTFADFKKNARF